MHLCYVSPAWPAAMASNGVATYVAELASGLRRAGVAVTILAPSTSHGSEEGVVRFEDLGVSPSGRSLLHRIHRRLDAFGTRQQETVESVAGAAARAAAMFGPIDALEVEESFGWAAGLSKRVDARVAVRLHGPWFLVGSAAGVTHDAAFRRRVREECRGIESAAALTSPAAHALDAVRARVPRVPSATAVIPNPIRLPPEERVWQPAESRAPTIAFIGRFDRVKGADVLLRAFRSIRGAHPTARLVFAGRDDGVPGSDGTVVRLREFIDRELPESVAAGVEYRGWVSPAEAEAIRLAASVVVVPSRYETFPYTLMEAMASGCPCVATRSTGMQEMVDEGRNGVLADPESPEDLARAVGALLADPVGAARLGAQARRDVRERYNADAIAARVLAFYRSVIGR